MGKADRLLQSQIQEMPNNRELVDNGKVELQNEHINELPQSMTPIPEEVFISTSAPNSVVIQYLRMRERHTISTHPINSVTSSRSGLETAEVRMPPIRSSKIKLNYSSRSHLNKKLPPTPISIPEPAKLRSSNPRSIPTSVATAQSFGICKTHANAWQIFFLSIVLDHPDLLVNIDNSCW